MRFSQVAFSVTLLLAASASALPGRRAAAASASFHLQNGQDAQKLNAQFQNLTASSACQTGEQACVGGDLGQCVGGKFSTTPCAAPLKCFALPLDNKPGTSIACDTEADALSRIAGTGATGGLTGGQ